MKEQEKGIVNQLPTVLKPQDRLFLEMAIADDDMEETRRLTKNYGVDVLSGSSPLSLCQDWLARIKKAEKHHCQNIIDLQSQGISIAGMQTEFTHERNA